MVASSIAIPKSTTSAEPRPDWLALYSEEIIDPGRRIIDAHHHLWDRIGSRYMLDELTDDIASGHNVVATVYVDCRSMYRKTGSDAFKPIGEVEFANGIAAQSACGAYGPAQVCAVIVSHANLSLGDDVRPVLEAQIKAGNGRYRGIRHISAWDADATVAGAYAQRPKHLLGEEQFRKGFAHLGQLGLTFDAWLYHPQIPELADLARAFPDQKIVLDHCGGPVGIGVYANRRDEIFKTWKASIQDIAKCPNVVVKLGGLAMLLLGYDFHTRAKPVSSEELAKAWKPYMETCIEAFGPDRCMFESNFPPDKGQCSYQVIWNALKRIAAPYSEAEKNRMFEGTATDVYKISLA